MTWVRSARDHVIGGVRIRRGFSRVPLSPQQLDGIKGVVVTDPPYGTSRKSMWASANSWADRWARAIADAALLLDSSRELVEAYARRVGIETPRSATDAAEDAKAIAAMGLGDHIEATAICVGCKLRMAAAVNLQPIYSVGSDVVRSLALARSSIELRTPPEAWTHAPPQQLFEPRGEEP